MERKKREGTAYLGNCPRCGAKARMRLRKLDGEIYTQAYCKKCGKEGPTAASYNPAAKMFGSVVYNT